MDLAPGEFNHITLLASNRNSQAGLTHIGTRKVLTCGMPKGSDIALCMAFARYSG